MIDRVHTPTTPEGWRALFFNKHKMPFRWAYYCIFGRYPAWSNLKPLSK